MTARAAPITVPPPWRKYGPHVLVLMALLGVASFIVRVSDYGDAVSTRKDFSIDYASARAMRDGIDPSEHWSDDLIARYVPPGLPTLGNPSWHTPLHLLIVLPLSFLPFVVAGVIWGVLSGAAIVGAAVLMGKAFGVSARTSALLGLAALALPLVQWDLWLGQVNGILLFLTVWAWSSLRSGQETKGALLLGCAGAIKLFPIFLAVPLLRRHRRAALVSVATCAFLIVVPLLVTGRLSEWLDLLSSTRSIYQALTENISLVGALSRALTPSPIITVLVMAIAVWVAWRSDFWTAGLVALAAWPIVWGHYYMLAIPWIAWHGARSTGNRRLVVLVLGLMMVGLARPTFIATAAAVAAVVLTLWPGTSTSGEATSSRPEALAEI